jgi:hypothetical protein
MKDWHPRSWLAMLMGIAVLLFIVLSAIARIVGVNPVTEAVGAWKEIVLSIVGGLMVWLGGTDRGGPDAHK